MNTIRFLAVPALFVLTLAGSASAQLRPKDPPPKDAVGEMKFFRVTITNQSDVTVIFTIEWDGKAAEKMMLDPGKKLVAETKQKPSPKKPVLTATYTPAPKVKDDVKDLESGHVDPSTNNPGIIYDFTKVETNEGVRVMLKPR